MAPILDPIQKIRDEVAAANGERSMQWYYGQIKRLGLRTGNEALYSGFGKFATGIQIGKMYLFAYDPKLKDSLPYYDTYPLVFPFASAEGGFRGINLHYLPPLARKTFIKELMRYLTATKLTEKSKLRLSWRVLQKYSQAQICVKQYLLSHVQSRFLEIDPRDWNTAALLPVENFVGASKKSIHKRGSRA